MNRYAIRIPKPVDTTAREKRNAVNMSQTVWLLNPERIFAGGRVHVRARTVIATTTLTPIGNGCDTNAMIVATNTASRWR
jgi:hypothetical protein